jgi:hypothetical protein
MAALYGHQRRSIPFEKQKKQLDSVESAFTDYMNENRKEEKIHLPWLSRREGMGHMQEVDVC